MGNNKEMKKDLVLLCRKRKEDLSIEELKKLPWFEHYSEEQLGEIIAVSKIFASLSVTLYLKESQDLKLKKITTLNLNKAA